ncbi:TIM barrel protein [Geoglobus acetivorans]|uniref:Sugar phosphate isomerase/epimerase n=1 Tax=Geoglobus acetivorans TaxID=565033 RepID=A0ABZ3H1P3_GEOAI
MILGFQPDVEHCLEQAFEFAAENGFNHVELLMDHPHYHYSAIHPQQVSELSMSYEIDVLIHAPAITTNFLAISDVARQASYEELRKTLYFAEKSEAKVVTVHIGWNPGFITSRGFIFREEWFDRHNEKVLTEEFLPFVRENEIIAIENTIGISGGIKKGLERIINETDVWLTFDIGHYAVKEGHDLFRENFDRVINVHLHDNRGDFDEHLKLGAGSIDFSIIPKNYRNYLTLELRDEDAILESKEFIYAHGFWM